MRQGGYFIIAIHGYNGHSNWKNKDAVPCPNVWFVGKGKQYTYGGVFVSDVRKFREFDEAAVHIEKLIRDRENNHWTYEIMYLTGKWWLDKPDALDAFHEIDSSQEACVIDHILLTKEINAQQEVFDRMCKPAFEMKTRDPETQHKLDLQIALLDSLMRKSAELAAICGYPQEEVNIATV